jgi:hypothetical protein
VEIFIHHRKDPLTSLFGNIVKYSTVNPFPIAMRATARHAMTALSLCREVDLQHAPLQGESFYTGKRQDDCRSRLGRVPAGARGGPRTRTVAGASRASRDQLQAIREWAAKNGYAPPNPPPPKLVTPRT